MKDQPKTLTPKLRFPKFIGQPLRRLELKDVTAESTVRNAETLPVASVMGVTKAEGIVPMEERLIAADIARYKIVRKDWFAYNPMRLNIGSIARWKGDNDILVSPDYVVFNCLEEADPALDPDYLDQFRQTGTWENFVTEGGDGSVRVRIYYKDIARIQLTLPSLAEQRKIAECLTSLDELIATEGRKLEALRAHKTGLMQQIFPRDGETRPRLRFPEFRKAPEWDRKALKDVCEVNPQNERLPDSFVYIDLESVEHGVLLSKKWVGREDAPSRAQRLLKNGDVVFQVVRPYQRNNLFVDFEDGESYVASTGYAHLRAYQSNSFLYQLVHTDPFVEKVIAKCTGSSYPAINSNHLAEVPVFVPDPAEQQRLAAFLSPLDALIASQSSKMDGMRSHKKGLMQQLFPIPT